jgi:hypothetical protein
MKLDTKIAKPRINPRQACPAGAFLSRSGFLEIVTIGTMDSVPGTAMPKHPPGSSSCIAEKSATKGASPR